MKKELLMTYDEYNNSKLSAPYSYILQCGDQCLYYFGSRHSYDPMDEQFNTIENFWNEFIDKTKGQERIVLLEGGNRPVFETKEKSIQEGGEGNFGAYLAKQKDIKTFSPEPPDNFLFSETLKYFSKEEIVYYYFARMCYQWNRMIVREDFETFMNKYLSRDAEDSGWTDFEFSINNLAAIHKKMFGTDFDKNDKDFFKDVASPLTEKTTINKVSRFMGSYLRDIYILEQIEKFWKEGKSIFIIYGGTHAIMHEPALRDMVENT